MSVSVPMSPGRVWLLAARPATLTAAAAPVLVGSACAYAVGGFALGPALAALVGAMLIQIGTNFANDVFDGERGVDGPSRLGPTRAVAAGLLTAAQMKRGMIVAFGLAVACGVYLAAVAGWPVIAIGVASVLSGIAYTGGPWPLGYHGLGDLFVMAFFGFVAVCGTAFVQVGAVPALAWWLAAPVGALATAVLVVNNLRDRAGDAVAGKRTLAVRLGRGGAIAEYVLVVAAFAVPVILVLRGAPTWVLLPLFAAPVGVVLIRRVAGSDGAALNPLLGATAKLLLLHSLLVAVGVVLGVSLGMKLRVRPVRWLMPAWHSAAGTWHERRALIIAAEIDGVIGVGEAAPLPGMSTDDVATCTEALSRLAPAPPPLDGDADVARAVAAWAHEAAPGAPAAAWGLFCAVLDAVARRRGVAMAALLAPAFERAPADRIALCEVVDGPDAARAAVARGLGTIKVKLGLGIEPDVASAAALIGALRDAVGPGVAIRGDANRAFSVKEAPRLLAALAPFAIEFIEEPARGLGPLLRTPSWPPIALDESLADPISDRWMSTAFAAGAVGVVVLKPTVLGPARTLLLARRARAAGVGVVISHALEGAVGLACAAELALALGEAPAAGLAPHHGLLSWALTIPTVNASELIAVPRLGTGLDLDATLAQTATLGPSA